MTKALTHPQHYTRVLFTFEKQWCAKPWILYRVWNWPVDWFSARNYAPEKPEEYSDMSDELWEDWGKAAIIGMLAVPSKEDSEFCKEVDKKLDKYFKNG
jgi:hypothetical protein